VLEVGSGGALEDREVLVDEAGTEAAAVTSVGVGVTSAPPMVRVDRPFLFAIRERLSGTILFVGRIMDPTAQ
jgi:serpin B